MPSVAKTKPLVWPWVHDTVDLFTTKLCWDIIIVSGASYVNGILGSWSHCNFQDNLMTDVLLLAMMGLNLRPFEN
jgi:hypothetical protein